MRNKHNDNFKNWVQDHLYYDSETVVEIKILSNLTINSGKSLGAT